MEIAETVDARKQRYGRAETLRLLDGVRTLIAVKGRSVTRVDLGRDRPGDDELASMMLGPTGNLRAPTVRSGGVLLVGFHPESWSEVFA